jgi:hypothetical protein
MQISGVSLTLTWPHRLCLLRVLLGATATVTSFRLSKHTGGGDAALAFSGLCVYLQLTWEVTLPRLLWSFPPTTTFTSFPAPGYRAGAATPAFTSRLVYLQFLKDSPPPLQCSGRPALFATCLFYCCLLFSLVFALFSLGGGWSVQGAMLIWPRFVCGSTECRLAHLVVCFSQAG